LLALALDEREAQVVGAGAEVHERVVQAATGLRAHLLGGDHLEALLRAGELLALALHDAPTELGGAFAQRQPGEETGWRRTDRHTELIIPLWPAASALVGQTERRVGSVGAT